MLVGDIAEAAPRWEIVLGTAPDSCGVHPLGTAMAARFLLDRRMLELVAPLPGKPSALRERLERRGEGPFALAIVASDLERTRAAIAAAGARIMYRPPHHIVHPADTAGVPLQITPQVHH